MRRKIPIGLSDFRRIIEENYVYVDKSLLIKEVFEEGSSVILLPRPRRFGKTLNMYMLKYFFEKTKEDNSVLFKDLKIWEHEELRKEQGTWPVIFITFKDIKRLTWEMCFKNFCQQISKLYNYHIYLLEGDILNSNEKIRFEDVLNDRADKSIYSTSIQVLCEYLYRYHGKKPIILIDEYDTPVYAAYENGYYKELMDFVRSLFGSALKDNVYLEKAVLTGILRLAKESIFSGLNNPKIATILNYEYSDKFGFTEEETKALLDDLEIEYKLEEVRKWYNGYVFGRNVIYNPWSIINYADKYEEGFSPYWVNTGSSEMIEKLLAKSGSNVKKEMEDLLQGRELVKEIHVDTVLPDIGNNPETLWSFLLFSGYLKAVDTNMVEAKIMCKLKIPNMELRHVFVEIIENWMRKGSSNDNYSLMLKSLLSGDLVTFDEVFADHVEKSLSYFDVGGNEPEKFYHAFVLGMLLSLSGEYQLKSNRESGLGRYDIMLIPFDKSKNGIVMEFKKVNRRQKETLDMACEAALKQIEKKGYRKDLEAMGINNVIEVGIAFEGKEVKAVGR